MKEMDKIFIRLTDVSGKWRSYNEEDMPIYDMKVSIGGVDLKQWIGMPKIYMEEFVKEIEYSMTGEKREIEYIHY
jgi:hypothetical protein